LTTGLLTYTGDLGIIQAVPLITVADVAFSCVVTDPLTTNIWVDLTLIHIWLRGERERERERERGRARGRERERESKRERERASEREGEREREFKN